MLIQLPKFSSTFNTLLKSSLNTPTITSSESEQSSFIFVIQKGIKSTNRFKCWERKLGTSLVSYRFQTRWQSTKVSTGEPDGTTPGSLEKRRCVTTSGLGKRAPAFPTSKLQFWGWPTCTHYSRKRPTTISHSAKYFQIAVTTELT